MTENMDHAMISKITVRSKTIMREINTINTVRSKTIMREINTVRSKPIMREINTVRSKTIMRQINTVRSKTIMRQIIYGLIEIIRLLLASEKLKKTDTVHPAVNHGCLTIVWEGG